MDSWRHLQAVLWSFVGLGRRHDMAEADRSARPLLLITIGLACTAAFVLVLLGLAHFAVAVLTPSA